MPDGAYDPMFVVLQALVLLVDYLSLALTSFPRAITKSSPLEMLIIDLALRFLVTCSLGVNS
jgi:hypothetical protein